VAVALPRTVATAAVPAPMNNTRFPRTAAPPPPFRLIDLPTSDSLRRHQSLRGGSQYSTSHNIIIIVIVSFIFIIIIDITACLRNGSPPGNEL